ncbi:dihydrofolate reductase [Vallitalea pronyensis]|uniref:Dihydrofolate reductase n=1 Tax=Vallitalea pronyensis TaxID=1348613 RepID=A0A8J8SI83_9FIRM|nr:dihydrofolate reductase family protein [Vallitalea pronyensis]QUI24223.1 dihydrofolate reductase [Vallitalea pronyensis]
MRKIILYIAISLDGYVADSKGRVDWLGGQDPNSQDTGTYEAFYKTIDTVILGYNTYKQIITELSPDAWVYAGMHSYVFTSRNLENTDDITFKNGDVVSLLKELKGKEGKDIWICGGASIVNQAIKANIIDQYRITIIPTILGSGIPLFDGKNDTIPLELTETITTNGMVELIYEKR